MAAEDFRAVIKYQKNIGAQDFENKHPKKNICPLFPCFYANQKWFVHAPVIDSQDGFSKLNNGLRGLGVSLKTPQTVA